MLTTQKIVDYLDHTNIASIGAPWSYLGARKGLKRWPSEVLPIPVFFWEGTREEDCNRVKQAVSQINKKLGREILALSTESYRKAFSKKAAMIVRFGTALDENGKPAQGHVGEFGGLTSYPSGWVDNFTLNGVIQVNIDGTTTDSQSGESTTAPRASDDVVIHEFGHALGLGEHFRGFGEPKNSSAIDKPFWRVLSLLYEYEAGTQKEDILIQSEWIVIINSAYSWLLNGLKKFMNGNAN